MNTILILSVCLPVALAYSTGPPTDVCSTMIPGHGDSTVSGTPPYEVTMDVTSYATGAPVQVSISGIEVATFRGFFVQARVKDSDFDTNDALGMFSGFPTGTGGVECSNPDSAWGHTSNPDKSSVMATWTYDGACEDVGNIAFRVTVVEGNPNTRYYTDIVSTELSFDTQMCVTEGAGTTTTIDDDDDDDDVDGAGMTTSSAIMIVASICCIVLLI